MADERIKLILDIAGEEGVRTLTTEATKLEQEIKDLVVSWQKGDVATADFLRTSAKLESQLRETQGVLTQVNSRDLDTLTTKSHQAAAATEKLSGGVAGTGQSLLQTGRVIQDFAQGGLGGILNNIEGLTMALGLGSGMAGILTVLGVAALTAGPAIKTAFKNLIDGSNGIPESTDKVKHLGESLKTTTERLEELRKQQSLTNTELAEFNRLTIEQVRLEKEEKAARAAKSLEETLNPEQRKGADVVKRATEAFGGKAVVDQVAKALDRVGMGAGDPQQGAKNLLFNVQRGDVKAHEVLRDVMARGANGTDLSDVLLGGKTPAERQKLTAKEREQRAKDEDDFRERKRKEKEAANKKVDELNETGQENQILTVKEQEHDKEQDKEKKRKSDIAAMRAEDRRRAKVDERNRAYFKDHPSTTSKEQQAAETAANKARYDEIMAQRQFAPPRPAPRRPKVLGPLGKPAALNRPHPVNVTGALTQQDRHRQEARAQVEATIAAAKARRPNTVDVRAAVKAQDQKAAQRRAAKALPPAAPTGPSPEQERSGPGSAAPPSAPPSPVAAITPVLSQIVANQAKIASNDSIRIQQLMQQARGVGNALSVNRSSASSGTI
jgi:hypothetical protein